MYPSIKELEADSMKMESQFSMLVSDLCRSLQVRRIPKDSLIASLMRFNCLKKVFGRKKKNQSVFRAQRRKLEDCSTSENVWQIIGDYFSFFRYDMIEQITHSLGSDEDKDKMKMYKINFIEYARRRLVKSNGEVPFLQFLLDSSYDDCELSHLKLLEWNLQSILNLDDEVVLKVQGQSSERDFTASSGEKVDTVGMI